MSELPSGWRIASLGEIGIVQSGIGFPNQEQGLTSGDYPVYKVGDVSRGVLQRNGNLQVAANYVTKRTAESLKGFVFPHGSTLFAKIGEALKLNRRGYVVRAGLADNNVMGYKGEPGVDDRFIYYFLKAQDFSSLSRSTTVPSIRKGDVEEVVVLLPPSAEQTRIAQKLDKLLAQVDTLKARIDAIPAVLKRFRQSVLSAAVSGRLTEEYREVNSLEKLWGSYRLGELCSLVTSGSRGWADYYSENGAAFIRSQDINTDDLDLSCTAFVTLPPSTEGKRTKVQGQDLLITITGANVGKVARVKRHIDEAYVSQHVALVRLSDLKNSAFIELFLKDIKSGRGVLAELAYGGGKPGLNLSNIRELVIPLPPLEEQNEIVRRVEQLFAFADQLEAKVQSAQARIDLLTQSLLAKAFRGELVAQDPSDEPASVLLERIRALRAAQPKARRGRKAAAAN